MRITDDEKREARKISSKKYRDKNIVNIKPTQAQKDDKKNEAQRAYVALHKAHIKQYLAAYYQSDKGKKSNRISSWKQMQIKSDNYEKLYERYISTANCELCDVELCSGNTKRNSRNLDHDHITGEVRHVLCKICNLKMR